MGFVSWGFVVLAGWLIDMSYWALKGSELPGACESFIEGVHGQKLLRGSKNVSIGRFCIGEYDENRHHIFGCMQFFWPLRGPTLIWGGLSPPVVRARDKKNPNVFCHPHNDLVLRQISGGGGGAICKGGGGGLGGGGRNGFPGLEIQSVA